MHPAPSVIVFTVASGAGYGLAFWLGLLRPELGYTATILAYGLAFVLISGGLLSSTLHLGNPQRAWRAFSQWRSSWLSREGVMALITFLPLCLCAFTAWNNGQPDLLSGVFLAICCVVTVYCTSQIYASIRAVPSWHSSLTVGCYLLFAAASGAFLLQNFVDGTGFWDGVSLLALLITSASVKWRWQQHADKPQETNAGTATGLGNLGIVRSLEHPHATGNYLTREMGYRVARKHSEKLQKLMVSLGLMIPVACVLVAAIFGGAGFWYALASLSLLIGLLIERWLFFATARHVVMSYYGNR